jgi:hypothetical protein
MSTNKPVKAGHLLASLYRCVKDSMGLDSIPGLLNQILTEGLWKEVYIEDFGEIVTYDKFNDFVTTAPPHGLGSSINTLVKLCPDHPEIISMIDEEIKRTKGGANNPKGVGGWNQRTINDIETDNLVNRYNVPIDKIGESPGGNSKQKGLRRLISEINKAKSPERRRPFCFEFPPGDSPILSVSISFIVL